MTTPPSGDPGTLVPLPEFGRERDPQCELLTVDR